MKYVSILPGAILLACCATANAGIPPNGADMRCLLVGMRLSTATDPQQKSAGLMLTTYFYSKLELTPPKDLEDPLAKEAREMSATDFRFEARRCVTILKEKAQAIKELGVSLERRRQEAGEKQDSASGALKPESGDEKRSQN